MRLLPGVNKGTITFAISSTIFYAIALYPSRNHLDTVRILELARSNESLDQWTSSYFRFLELLSLGGKFGMLPAIFGLVCLGFAFLFFISSFECNIKILNLVARLFLLSPYIGVFGMTLTHEVQAVTGVLILSGVLARITLRSVPNSSENKLPIILGAVLLSMIHNGIFIFLGFALAYIMIRRKNVLFLSLFSLGLIIVTLYGHSIFDVTEQSKAMRYQSVLGDIKCIAQHPNAKISSSDWELLLKAGRQDEWTLPSTCSYSRVFFAFPWVEKNQLKTMKLWIKLAIQNPQIAIEARIQRSANALPPLLFTTPQPAIQVKYLEPVGLGTQDNLLVWSPLFKTSNDDEYQKQNFRTPKGLSFLEALAVLPAHLLNRNSSLWGWGGLWLSIAWLASYLNGRFRPRELNYIFLPQIFTILSLILFSPVSDPRYSLSITIPSIAMATLFIFELLSRTRERLALNAN